MRAVLVLSLAAACSGPTVPERIARSGGVGVTLAVPEGCSAEQVSEVIAGRIDGIAEVWGTVSHEGQTVQVVVTGALGDQGWRRLTQPMRWEISPALEVRTGPAPSEGRWISGANPTAVQSFRVPSEPSFTSSDIRRTQVVPGLYGEPVVQVTWTDDASERFAAFTRRLVGEQFVIAIDGELVSAPIVAEPIDGPVAQLTGGVDDVPWWAAGISRPLPCAIERVLERHIGPAE